MKANAAKSVPLGGAFWEGGAETFIHKGTNGRWREVLSAEQIDQYEKPNNRLHQILFCCHLLCREATTPLGCALLCLSRCCSEISVSIKWSNIIMSHNSFTNCPEASIIIIRLVKNLSV